MQNVLLDTCSNTLSVASGCSMKRSWNLREAESHRRRYVTLRLYGKAPLQVHPLLLDCRRHVTSQTPAPTTVYCIPPEMRDRTTLSLVICFVWIFYHSSRKRNKCRGSSLCVGSSLPVGSSLHMGSFLVCGVISPCGVIAPCGVILLWGIYKWHHGSQSWSGFI